MEKIRTFVFVKDEEGNIILINENNLKEEKK